MAVALLAAAGLQVRSFLNLMSAALGLVVALALAALVSATRKARRATRAGLIGALVVAIVGPAAALRPQRPIESASPLGKGTALGYVSSAACVSCHPGEHASFRHTYHRSMTQAATPDTVQAPLDGRPLVLDGRTIRLERRRDEVWATLPDPDAVIAGEPAPDVTRRVVLTTGSHREQAFWVSGERSGDLRLVPFVWLVRDAAWRARWSFPARAPTTWRRPTSTA
jgi:hypothetical protein